MKVLLPKKKQKNQALKLKIMPSMKKSKIEIKILRCNWDPEATELATESINKVEMNVTDASKIFNISRQMLDDRVHGKYGLFMKIWLYLKLY